MFKATLQEAGVLRSTFVASRSSGEKGDGRAQQVRRWLREKKRMLKNYVRADKAGRVFPKRTKKLTWSLQGGRVVGA